MGRSQGLKKGQGTQTGKRSTATLPPAPKVRASGLTRERIVESTLRYLREHPDKRLTIARAAAASGAKTMAVYGHFKDGADLAEAIVQKVLEGLSQEVSKDADWRIEIRSWMEIIFRRFAAVPQSIDLLRTKNGLSVGISVPWMHVAEGLRTTLHAAGMRDPMLSKTTFWLQFTIAGFVRSMLAIPLESSVAGAISAIKRLDPEGTTTHFTQGVAIRELYSGAQEMAITRTLASLEVLFERGV